MLCLLYHEKNSFRGVYTNSGDEYLEKNKLLLTNYVISVIIYLEKIQIRITSKLLL